MVQVRSPKDLDNKEYNKRRSRVREDKSEENKDYLKIWKAVNPSFKDINTTRSIIKLMFMISMSSVFVISLYLVTNSLSASVGLYAFFLIIFLLVFHEEFFYLRSFILNFFGSRIEFNPFEDFAFWFDSDDPETLLVCNKKDLITFAIRIYSIEVIPENIHPTIDQFVKSFSIEDIRISYSYQLVQRPIINLFDRNSSQQEALLPYESAIGKIFFTIFCEAKGMLTQYKLDRLNHYIEEYTNNLKSNIVSNFHHFKARLLSDEELLNALRLLYVKAGTEVIEQTNKFSIKSSNKYIFFKLLVLGFILIYSGWFFSVVVLLNVWMVFIIESVIILLIIFIWWRSLLFGITKRKLLNTETTVLVSPFKGVKFYTIRKFPYSLFMHIDKQLLIGMKMVNLRNLHSSPFRLFGRFIENLNNHKIYFTYTLKNEPLDYYYFYEHGLDYANERTQKLRYSIENKQQGENWMAYRNGIWYSYLTMSVNTYKFVSSPHVSDFEHMEKHLTIQINTLRGAFQLNFHNYKLEDLKKERLLFGFLYSVFKHNNFRINGSYLNYVMLQGTTVAPLNYIVDILKKSVDTKIAAEFNTPLHLRNFIDIGYTINTEVLEEEVAFGFTFDQLQNLLIVNGISQQRQFTIMKIVSELIQKGEPSLIFDFDGEWARLLPLFEGTKFKREILHFQLGRAFTVNPLASEIPYDKHNPEYIEYMLDAFALAFRKDQRNIDMFRSIISRNPEMDLPSMELEYKTQSDWQKNQTSYFLQSLFSDLTPLDRTFFQELQGDSKHKILAHDFIRNEKTIIIDLTALKDNTKKLFFTFMILSKFIHYAKYEKDYYKKVIVVPYIDLFFNYRFLDMKLNYGKINSFLDPLKKYGFGLIFSANQISYLHPNLHNYFNNIITFRAIVNKDISELRNIMSLQEIIGTGVYSSTRNQTYQLEYLKTLKDNQIIVRRDDIYQSFPAAIDWGEIKKTELPSYEEIVEFMLDQGYDLQSTEQKILSGAMQTIFEKDFGMYYSYIDEIINFLKSISSTDRVGNLYDTTIKKELMKYLYPKLSKKTNNKEYMKNVRDDIYKKLLKHEYLVEDHPNRASGSETLATSYKVGAQYNESLKDYFEIKGKNTDIQIEEVNEDVFPSPTREYIIPQKNLWGAIKREFGGLYYDVSKIHDLLKKKQFSNAIKVEQIVVKKYLTNIYRHYYNVEEPTDMMPLFELLENMDDFPFTTKELETYFNQLQQINLDVDDPKTIAENAYKSIFSFYSKIKKFTIKE